MGSYSEKDAQRLVRGLPALPPHVLWPDGTEHMQWGHCLCAGSQMCSRQSCTVCTHCTHCPWLIDLGRATPAALG